MINFDETASRKSYKSLPESKEYKAVKAKLEALPADVKLALGLDERDERQYQHDIQMLATLGQLHFSHLAPKVSELKGLSSDNFVAGLKDIFTATLMHHSNPNEKFEYPNFRKGQSEESLDGLETSFQEITDNLMEVPLLTLVKQHYQMHKDERNENNLWLKRGTARQSPSQQRFNRGGRKFH